MLRASILVAGLLTALSPGADRQAERDKMVDQQIVARGVKNQRVVKAMRDVPRHWFVPGEHAPQAYRDTPLPIGYEQTISQPYIVAEMTALIDPQPGQKILEIGTGSGYQAAVLSRLVESNGKVFTIEIVKELAARAKKDLAAHNFTNVEVLAGDGYRGIPKEAPFDAIVVTAAPDHVPAPLVEQLKLGGRMIIPVGDRFQKLQLLEKTKAGMVTKTIFEVRFVPMTGEAQKKE